MPLPSDRPRSYQELADMLMAQLPTDRFALVAESFSGPLAILLANRCPRVFAVVLCASFVQSPVPEMFARVPSLLWRAPLPVPAIRLLMTGGDRVLAHAVRRVVLSVNREILVSRISAVLRADVRCELERMSHPLLWIEATRDRLVRGTRAGVIRSLKPSAEFVKVDGPHLLLQANPAGTWSQIEPFLRRTWSPVVG